MSRRSRARRKLARQNYRSSRETPRAIAAQMGERSRTYPKASELLASGHGWREFLETTLRSVLRPVAIVGAVGLAGCGAQSHATVSGDPKPSGPEAPGTGAVLVPMPPPGGHTTQSGQQVITGSLPPPPTNGGGTPVVQNGSTPPIHHPPSGIIHGAPPVVPIPVPVQVRGEMTSVTPIPQPVPLGGAPMPTMPDPVVPTPPTPDHVQPPTPPTSPTPPTPVVSPNPEPIPMPGGMAAVMPVTPVRSA